jgi:hypothetical protein
MSFCSFAHIWAALTVFCVLLITVGAISVYVTAWLESPRQTTAERVTVYFSAVVFCWMAIYGFISLWHEVTGTGL